MEFWNEERELAGWRVLEGPQTEPITVRLQPCGFLTGRIVDAQGDPIVKALLLGWPRNEDDPATAGEPPKDYYFTDQHGRFRIVGLAPGLKYNIGVKEQPEGPMTPMIIDAIVKPGETKDLGDFAPSEVKEAVTALQKSMSREEVENLSEVEIMKRVGVIDGSR